MKADNLNLDPAPQAESQRLLQIFALCRFVTGQDRLYQREEALVPVEAAVRVASAPVDSAVWG